MRNIIKKQITRHEQDVMDYKQQIIEIEKCLTKRPAINAVTKAHFNDVIACLNARCSLAKLAVQLLRGLQ
jgi:hypothetical protein